MAVIGAPESKTDRAVAAFEVLSVSDIEPCTLYIIRIEYYGLDTLHQETL